VAVVAGSVASAEERQLHTLEWQLLLPRPSWQQWLVKTGTAYLLAMGLGLALPALLYAVTPAVRHDMAAVIVFPLLVIALLTSASLYISSLCRTSIKALLVALPAAFGFTDLINTWFILPMSEFTGAGLTTLQFDRLLPALATLHYQYLRMRSDLDLGLTLAAMPLASIGGLLTLLIYFGSRNHRSAERSLSTTLSQLACMTAVLVISGTVWSGAFDMYRERIDPGYRWMIEQQRLHPDWKFPMK
jgi:hypothetical protein